MDDLLRGVKDMVDEDEADVKAPDDLPDDFEMPSMDALMEMIKGLNMSEEQKEQLKKGLEAQKMMGGSQVPPGDVGGYTPLYMDSTRIYVFVACVVVIVIIFGQKVRKMGDFEDFEEVRPEYGDENVLPPGADFKMPNLEELLEALEHLDLPEAEKEEIKRNAMRNAPDVNSAETSRFYAFIVAIVLIVLIFVFFGYKLYRSLTEKERKKEEKRKLKQKKKQK